VALSATRVLKVNNPLFISGSIRINRFPNKTDKKEAKLERTAHATASQKLTA